MKIIRDDIAYVQLNDIVFLEQSNLPIPDSIKQQLMEETSLINSNSNGTSFISFTSPEVIEFFRELDIIIDYDDIKGLTQDELISMINEAIMEQNKLSEKYNRIPFEERRQYHEMVTNNDLLRFKITTLEEYFWFRDGKRKLKFPDGIEEPPNNITKIFQIALKRLFTKAK